MAEEVQAALDEMVPGLKDLQDRQVFTPDEVHQIVDRRRNSEYDLRRVSEVRKSDFLRYIQAEMDLEKLRKLRCKKLRRQQLEQEREHRQQASRSEAEEEEESTPAGQDTPTNLAKHIGDAHIVHHIHQLWKRTLLKFGKSDFGLYLQYAKYCQEIHAQATLSRIMAEALQLYPHESTLWIEAARHEYFGLGSIHNARVLFQRGLRVMATDPSAQRDLWLQLFSFEMHFVERLRARQKILKGGSKDVGEGSEEKLNEGHVKESNLEDDGNDEGGNSSDSKSSQDPFHIARVVYRNAVAAIPKDVAFRLQFWDQCRPFAESEGLQKDIVNSIRNDLCQDNPEAWMAWALYQWEQKQKRRQEEPPQQQKPGTGGDDDDNDDPKEGEAQAGADDDAPPQGIAEDTQNDEAGDKAEVAKQPSKSKRRFSGISSGQDEAMSVLDVLRQATQTLPTNEMYLKAVRMITRYIASLQEAEGHDDDDDDDDEDSDIAVGIDLLETLFREAEQLDILSSDLVMEHALLLSRLERKEEAAECLKRAANATPTEDALKIWLYLAELSESGPVAVLQTALNKTDMSHRTYYELLLHLFGAKLQARYDDTDLVSLFEKITLLTPGFLPLQEIDEPIFGVRHALDAAVQFLQYLNEKHDTVPARKVYRNVLVESSLGSIFASSFDDQSLIDFIEEACKVEKLANGFSPDETNRKNLIRLYDEASKLFGNTEVGRKYQERKSEEMLFGTPATREDPNARFRVSYQDSNASAAFSDSFAKFQLVHLKGPCHAENNDRRRTLGWEDIVGIFRCLTDDDKSSWCVETPGSVGGRLGQHPNGAATAISPVEFLSPAGEGTNETTTTKTRRGYCSFLVQKDNTALVHVLERVPATDPHPGIQWHYPHPLEGGGRAIWFFFGWNPRNNLNLDGRPEHTDSISSDGTWHYQLSGCKIWILRPTPMLLDHLRQQRHGVTKNKEVDWNRNTRLFIHCEEGDILCLNTRLWFHRTIIPPQSVPSVSYARDGFVKEQAMEDTAGPSLSVAASEAPTHQQGEDTTTTSTSMMNVDGFYATDVIGAGVVILTEEEMPDCELHRSRIPEDANCEIAELCDGTHALVSRRVIAAGEFFTVAESEDDDDDDEEEKDEEEAGALEEGGGEEEEGED